MKKGFTLIELLAIITILALISFITIPIVIDSINEAREGTYKVQVNEINRSAEKLLMDYNKDVDDNGSVLYLTDIVSKDYLENTTIINPKDKKQMTGCVLITLYSNQYHFTYIPEDEKCQNYPNLLDN